MDGIFERERLRRTFDAVAEEYQGARPEYPEALYEALISLTGVVAGVDELCEVGCASGKATLPLARRGFAICCVELGGALAAEARRNLAGFGRVRVEQAEFEAWAPGRGDRGDLEAWTAGEAAGTVRDDGVGGFGLLFAATAWHWIDPAVKYRKAWSLLRPGGHLAFWEASHVVPESGGDPFFAEIQDVYDEIGSGMPAGWVSPTPATLPDGRAEIEASGLFADVTAPAVRLGGQVHRRRVHPAARDVLEQPVDGGLAAGAAVRGDPAAAGAAAGRAAAAALGCGAERGPEAITSCLSLLVAGFTGQRGRHVLPGWAA